MDRALTEKIARKRALRKEKLNQKAAMEDNNNKRKQDTKTSKPATKIRVETEQEESERMTKALKLKVAKKKFHTARRPFKSKALRSFMIFGPTKQKIK